MWIKRGVRVVCLVPSAVLVWCKNAVDGYRRFVTRIADHVTMAGRENQLEAAAMANSGVPLHVDCSGKRVELRESLQDAIQADSCGDVGGDGALTCSLIGARRAFVMAAAIVRDRAETELWRDESPN